MRIEVLGTVQLRDDDAKVVDVPERKVRAMIAALVAAGGEPVSAEKLVDQVWGENLPRHPIKVLQAKLSQLRSLLDSASPGARQLLVRSPAGYSLQVSSEIHDVSEFNALVQQATNLTDPPQQRRVLQRALSLFTGEPYGEFSDQLWLAADITRLKEARLQAVELIVSALNAQGDYQAAISVAIPHSVANPTRESLVGPLILAHYHTGNQPEALAAYERLRSHLAEEYGTDPSPELQELHLKILRQDPELGVPEPGGQSPSEPEVAHSEPRQHLPSYASPFFNRDTELNQVLHLLTTHRLVTLMGIGGVGKTRLAVEAASHHAAEAQFVDLTELDAQVSNDTSATVQAVSRAIAAALGLPTPRDGQGDITARIATSLQHRDTLLVLDNCEHVLDGAVACVQRLLREVASLRILTTSREPLALPEEQRYSVPLLAVNGEPTDGDLSPMSPAVEFFFTRAMAVNPSLEIDQPTVQAATELSRHVDGLPLALELAAARTNLLSVPELVERIADRLDLLQRPGRSAPRRQQTLRGMLDWSWSLLDPPEQALLRRLAVHPTSWRLDMIEAVCAHQKSEPLPEQESDPSYLGQAPGATSLSSYGVLPALSRLVDSSLVTTVATRAGMRYRLLETVHSYAAEKLEESGERPRVATGHLEYLCEMVRCAEQNVFSRHAQGWVRWMDAERSHLGHGLSEAVRSGDGSGAAALAISTFWFRWMTSRIEPLAEDLAAVEQCLTHRPDTVEPNLHAQVRLLARSLNEQEPDHRMQAVRQALNAFSDDAAGQRAKMQFQWFAANCLLANQTHRDQARELVDESVTYLIREGEAPLAAFASAQRDWFLVEHWGIGPQGLPGGYHAETVLREHGDVYGLTQLLAVQYLVAATDGDAERVEAIITEGAQLTESLGLDGELAFWELVWALHDLSAHQLSAAQHHLQQSKNLATRTAYSYVLTQVDAVQAVLAAWQGDDAQAQSLLTGLNPADRDLAYRTISRVLDPSDLPVGLQLSPV